MARKPKDDKPAPAWEPPKTLGACADELYALRQERAKVQAIADEIERKEKLIKEKLINELPKSDQTGALGKVAKAVIKTKNVPQVKDWDKFYAFVARKKRFDLLQRRLSEGAIGDMWDANLQVPGVEAFPVVTVGLTKI